MPRILGLGSALPTRRVGNDELARSLGRNGEEIGRASGVEARYYAEDGQGPSDLARVAAERAFAATGLGPGDVEFLVFATATPDVTFPGSGCYLQDKLGCGTIGALDVRAQCSGFLYALDIADQFLRAGTYRNVLVAAGEVHSSGLDFSPRGAEVTPLFGDGAAVAILDAAGDGLVHTILHADGTDLESFWCEFPSSRRVPTRFLPEDLDRARHYPRLDPERVRRDGTKQMAEAVDEVLAGASVKLADVRRFVLHHVYRDVAETVADRLGIRDRAVLEGRDGGHIASASLPLALCRARERGDVAAGDLVCLATAGSGATWGASLLVCP